MEGLFRILVCGLLLAAFPAWGEDYTVKRQQNAGMAPTAQEAEEAFQAARQGFLAVASGGADVSGSRVVVSDSPVTPIAGGDKQNIDLEQINVMLDVTDVTLRDVMRRVVEQAAAYTGPWTVKWRLSPDNAALMDERVNLTAEADFGTFCGLLADRVKNMTGTQLFVTAFEGNRVLLVTDTYY